MSTYMPQKYNAIRGNCFIVKRSKSPYYEEEILEYLPRTKRKKKRNEYISDILANIVIGLIFVGVAAWAFPIAFSRTAVEIERLRSVVGPGIERAAAATIPVSNDVTEQASLPAVGGDAKQETKNRFIALPQSIAREIFREQAFGKPSAGAVTASEATTGNRSARPTAANNTAIIVVPGISGIACSGEHVCSVIIDNTIYRVDDVIGNAIIEDITERRVLLRSIADPSKKYYMGI